VRPSIGDIRDATDRGLGHRAATGPGQGCGEVAGGWLGSPGPVARAGIGGPDQPAFSSGR